jgi:Protein of unknown function (DUF2501)
MFRPIVATSLILLGASAGTAQLPSIIGMGADNVLDKLNKKPGVKGSGAFKSGETGIIHAGKKDISLDSLKGDAKGKMCSMVLKQSASLL